MKILVVTGSRAWADSPVSDRWVRQVIARHGGVEQELDPVLRKLGTVEHAVKAGDLGDSLSSGAGLPDQILILRGDEFPLQQGPLHRSAPETPVIIAFRRQQHEGDRRRAPCLDQGEAFEEFIQRAKAAWHDNQGIEIGRAHV